MPKPGSSPVGEEQPRGHVRGQTGQGVEASGVLRRINRHGAVFDVFGPPPPLQLSEVFPELRISIADRVVYSGRAVINQLVDTGSGLTCEVSLEEAWFEEGLAALASDARSVEEQCARFFDDWRRVYRVGDELKVAVAELQAFLMELRLWLEQIGLGVRSVPMEEQESLERDLAHRVGGPLVPVLTQLFERFERAVELVPEEARAACRFYVQRQLHPLLLCAPFLHRTFLKPLGYAGDYEMVNMLARDPCEGSSLYAKVVNLWFLRQPPAEAHRNRLTYLEEKLTAAALGAAQLRRSARILTVGCGPALEVQRFLRQPALARHATFTLVDFNDETLRYARHQLEELRDRTGMPTQFQFVRKSVAQLLKESAAGERGSVTAAYDLVYCAGLFDYVADALCQRLSGLLYRWVLPGGLYVATNVDPSNARRLTMDYVMEWGLIYRNGEELANLRPDGVERQQCRVLADATGANVFLEVPKPRA